MCEGYKKKLAIAIIRYIRKNTGKDKRESKLNPPRIEIDSRLFDLKR